MHDVKKILPTDVGAVRHASDGADTAGRRGVGFELKDSYWRQAVGNLERLQLERLGAAGDLV